MKNLKQISILIAAVAILFSSCSKDEATPTATPFASTFTAANLTAKIPTSLATKSPQTSSQVQAMVDMMTIVDNLQKTKPQGKESRRDSWVSGDFTINYTGSDSATQHLYSYTITQGSVTFYTINGWENINGSAGHWVLDISAAATSETAIGVDFDWTKNSSNDFNLDMLVITGQDNVHITANINNDSSGDLFLYSGAMLLMKSVWNATGSGQYTDYSTTPPTVTAY